jgi:hypothetical protein
MQRVPATGRVSFGDSGPLKMQRAPLMSTLGLQGVIRGRPARTTVSDKAVSCLLDRINRQFHAAAPNQR